MAYTPVYQTKFKRDVRRAKKRQLDQGKLKQVMSKLIEGKPLAAHHYDHPLKGDYSDCRECHITPDWLLIYMITGHDIIFVRTGSHADLFN